MAKPTQREWYALLVAESRRSNRNDKLPARQQASVPQILRAASVRPTAHARPAPSLEMSLPRCLRNGAVAPARDRNVVDRGTYGLCPAVLERRKVLLARDYWLRPSKPEVTHTLPVFPVTRLAHLFDRV